MCFARIRDNLPTQDLHWCLSADTSWGLQGMELRTALPCSPGKPAAQSPLAAGRKTENFNSNQNVPSAQTAFAFPPSQLSLSLKDRLATELQSWVFLRSPMSTECFTLPVMGIQISPWDFSAQAEICHCPEAVYANPWLFTQVEPSSPWLL